MADEPHVQEGSIAKSAAAKLFDIRVLIGGLFIVYGVILTVVGIFDSQAELDKAAGIRINLWLGLGMLALGLFFAVWAKVNPVKHEEPRPEQRDRPPAHH